jgi:hypothetical protein
MTAKQKIPVDHVDGVTEYELVTPPYYDFNFERFMASVSTERGLRFVTCSMIEDSGKAVWVFLVHIETGFPPGPAKEEMQYV